MKVEQAKIVDLLKRLGVDSADRWDAAKIATKVNQEGGIARYKDVSDTLPEELGSLFDELVADQTGGGVIEVVPSVDSEPTVGTEPESAPAAPANGKPKKKPVAGKRPKTVKKPRNEPAAKKPAALTNGRRSARYDGFGTFSEWIAHLKKNPKELPTDGVLFVTVRELRAAGKRANPKGVTKEYLLGVLHEEFPDRPMEKLETNLNNNVPTRLNWMYGIHVWSVKGDNNTKLGYYISGDGKTPQPKSAAPAPPAKKKPAKKKAKK